MVVNELLTPLVSILMGGIGGFLVVYAIRKTIKWIAIIAGILIFPLLVLVYAGWFEANYDKMTADATQFVNDTDISSHVNNFPPLVLVGLVIGGVVGFIKAS